MIKVLRENKWYSDNVQKNYITNIVFYNRYIRSIIWKMNGMFLQGALFWDLIYNIDTGKWRNVFSYLIQIGCSPNDEKSYFINHVLL